MGINVSVLCARGGRSGHDNGMFNHSLCVSAVTRPCSTSNGVVLHPSPCCRTRTGPLLSSRRKTCSGGVIAGHLFTADCLRLAPVGKLALGALFGISCRRRRRKLCHSCRDIDRLRDTGNDCVSGSRGRCVGCA